MKLSVILPSLNVEKYIGECLKSVCEQQLAETEILCVDAGSTDGTIEIINSYIEKYDNVSLIHSSKRSYGYQVNEGIRQAKGKYIAILETDDYIEPDMYVKLYEAAENNGLDIAKMDWEYVYMNKKGYRYSAKSILPEKSGKYNQVISINDYPELTRYDYSNWSGIYNKNFLLENEVMCNETAGAAFQDIGFVIHSLVKARRIMYLTGCGYHYRFASEGASTWNPKVLMFAYQEWKRLIDLQIISVKSIQNYDVTRLVDSFNTELAKALRMNNYDSESELIKPYFDWFVTTINQIKEMGALNVPEINPNITEYIEKLKIEDSKYEENIKSLLNAIDNSSVVVFGCGFVGAQIVDSLWNNEVEVVALTDNNRQLWGKKMWGYEVLSPDDAVEKYSTDKFVISTRKYASEVQKQLCDLGINQEKIVMGINL